MISVGICAYNEEKSIGKTINSVLPQLNRKDELLVVASGCTDATTEIVRGLGRKDKRIKLIVEKERKGKASAINKILRNAKGDKIVLTDADILLEKDAIKNLVNKLKGNTGAVIGATTSFKKENFLDKLQDFAWQVFNETRLEQSEKGELFALNGYLSAVKKGIVYDISLNSLVDDWALGWQIKEKGHSIVFEPKAIVKVKAAQNISDYIKQKTRIRIGQLQIKQNGMKLDYLRKPSHLRYLFKSPYALPYLFLDSLIWIKAFFDFKRNKLQWQQINSSKI